MVNIPFEAFLERCSRQVLEGRQFGLVWVEVFERAMAEPWIAGQIQSVCHEVGNKISQEHCAMWLLERATEVGSSVALAELSTFVEAPFDHEFPTLILERVNFASSHESVAFEFSNGVVLGTLSALEEFVFAGVKVGPLDVFLTCENEPLDRSSFSEKAHDVCRALTLVRRDSQTVASKYITSIWKRAAPRSFDTDLSSAPGPRGVIGPPITAAQLERADRILAVFDSMESGQRDFVRRLLDRWMSVCGFASLEDRSVDLRICLDMFLVQDKGEHAHKASRRGALFLGGDLELRIENAAILKKAYNSGSNSVHQGGVRGATLAQINAARDLFRQILLRWFSAGAPTLTSERWTALEMGRDFEGVFET